MASERLNRSIDKIEQAVALLEQRGEETAAKSTDDRELAALTEQFESAEREHRDALEDRDRTVAKLRADVDDINKLKDAEIARLRSEIENRGNAAGEAAEASKAETDRLREKCDRLEQTSRQAIGRLDAAIAAATAESGS